MSFNSKFKMLVLSHDGNHDDRLQKIYDLNQANTPEVGSLESVDYLHKLIELSAYNLLVLKGDEVIGFIICMREGSAYGSENYKFFSRKLKKFLYVDRVAIEKNYRREGLGKAIYDDIFNEAKIENLPIALEVNTEPVNQPSLNFHEKMGFDQIGAKEFADHSVAYFIK
ncbi:MAG: GNAT family N-acetyltransferase [Gammaproteobacteria bacterium]|nr:GNAT family N-acetyltransferase [Gammaproteobacteria bacterium]